MQEKEQRELNIDVKVGQLEAMNALLKDSIKQQGDTIKRLHIEILALIAAIVLIVAAGFGSFVWYESQFEYVDMETDGQDIEISTDGSNASAECNDINGNQYNDSSIHNEGVEKWQQQE